ncbi:hypothetical protein BDR03DRAFT_1019443 [Suillus americanus]|nr:hypothetical protein BDR03DRAFT_1019443 [Suillus americanus]
MSNTQRSMQVRTTQRQMTQISVTGNLTTCLMMTSTPTSRRKRHRRIHDLNDSETDEERNSRPQKKLKFAHVSIPAHAKPAPAPRTKPAPKSRMTQAPSRHLELPLPTPTRPDPPPAAKPKPISSSDIRTTKVATEAPSTTKPKAKPVPIPRSTRAKTKPKSTEASAAHLKIDTAVNDDDDTYEFADLPLVCPNDNCRNLVPAGPNIELVKQLRQWNSFKNTNRCLTSEGLRLELEICAALRQLREEKLNIQRAKAREWPTIITWETVSDRVLQMEAELNLMIHDKNTRRYSF